MRAFEALAKGVLINIMSSLLFCLFVWLLAARLGQIWSSQEGIAEFIPLAAMNVAAQLILTDGLYGALRVFNRVSEIAMIQAGIAIARLGIIALFLSWFHIGLRDIFLLGGACYLLGALVLVVIVFIRSRAELGQRFLPSPSRLFAFTFDQRKYILHNYLTYLCALPGRDLDINVLGFFAAAESVGVYRMAKNFVALLWTATDPIHLVLYPEYARLWSQRAWPKLRAFTIRLMALLVALAAAIFLSGCLVVPPAIVLFAGKKFSESGSLFIIMAVSMLFWLPQKWLPPLVLAAGRAEINMQAALVSGLLGVAVYWFLGQRYGAVGIAWSYSINLVLLVSMQFALAWRAGVVQHALSRPYSSALLP